MMKGLPLFSLFFIALVASPAGLASALILIVPPFFLKEILLRKKSSPKFWVFLIYILFAFAVLKNYFGFGETIINATNFAGLKPLLESVGLSFIIFRAIEYLIVAPAGIIGRKVNIADVSKPADFARRFWKYLGFCLAFPTFTSGPITRWRGFGKDYAGDEPVFETQDALKDQVRRIANGFVKISFLSQPLLLLILGFSGIIDTLAQTNLNYFLFVLSAALIYLYFLFINFSAFTDVMIGAGRFVGLNLPENFDKPFSSKNFLDFWSHWHLSVSLWFRDLSFTPIVKFFVLKGVKSNFLCSAVAYVVTFGTLGLWHGRTWPFILCGILLAVGALYNQIYREFLAPRVNAALKDGSLSANIWAQLGRSLTYLFIAIAITGLWLGGESMAVFWKHLFSGAGLAAIVMLTLAFAVVIVLTDAAIGALKPLLTASGTLRLWETNNLAMSAIKTVIAVALWIWLALDGGGFVYEGF